MSSRRVKKGVGTQRRAEVPATGLGNGDSTSPFSSLGVPRPPAAPPHASSSSSPGAPQQPSVPPQASFPYSASPQPPPMLWPGFEVSNSVGHSPHGNQSTNPWGYPPPPGENFHLVGHTQAFNPFSPPPLTPYAKGTPPPPPPAAENTVNLDTDVDDVVEASRTAKKRHWTHDEEIRLASAWLNTSKDPIHGNDKNRDTFWGQISDEFNRNIQPHLRRDINVLKIHWGRLSKLINEFNGYWSSVTKVNKSGYSDDMLMEEAQKMYEKKHGKPFALVHWWKKLKNEPKWCASFAQLEKEKNKRVDVDASDDGEEARPIGREAAKAQLKGKRKVEEVKDGISMLGDNINKIAEITQERKKEREKVTEAQLEISRNQLKTAIEQKEAKLLEAYTSLLVQDTSQMTQEVKATRDKALACMSQKLFGNHEQA